MQSTVLSYLLLAVSALSVVTTALSSPAAMLIVPGGVPESESDWHNLLRRDADDKIVRRQSSSGARNESDIEKLDLQSWARETTLRCIDKLRNVTKASNPSGIAVCYNLPFLSTKSGVFAADLRLYQVSAPEGDWATVGGNIDVSLMYNGAAVQVRNETAEEAAATAQASANSEGPQKVQEFHFIGQIDKMLLADDMSDLEMQNMLKPNISLFANTPGGAQLTTVLSADEATFVNGIFADVAPAGQNNTAAIDAPFKLPGTRIEIVPIGLYFFGTYLVIACSIFGWGI
ncbi:unnamed protein product [Tuber melanosporum]|uniref:(Perigord truffle) hypothetical protein n=1 Tax=Tuber melanosporum (strain Mel28) TaxID=656061 RepID=D5G617_TUBMM|nr:uncharacterized protein GSTUM_00001728001 [Tuber melanosporum]CAZ79960.1 unnamed protein product [Tuber melanosporum]